MPEAINTFHKLGYLVVVVTNQTAVARGMCSVNDVEKINGRLEYLLAKEGTFLDRIYFCPHHPDEGFEGENITYKIKCNCRKPEPGMVLRAKADFNIDLENSFLAGDTERDIRCAHNSGCKAVLIGENNIADDIPYIRYTSLLEFSEAL